MIPRPALMIPWRNTIASPLTTIVAVTLDGTPELVDTESIPLPLTLGRDYWVSADAAADADPDGEGGDGDLVALLAAGLVAEVATIDAVEPSWTTDGRLRLTATLSGAAVQWGIFTVHEDDEPAWTMARLLGLPIIPDAAPQAISAGAVLTMPLMSDRLFWPGRPFHRDSRDRDEFVGSVSHTTDGFAWPAVQTAPVVRREVGWDYLRLQHVLEEYADELGPFNTAETIRREGLRWGRRVRLYGDIGDLGTTDAYSVYRPREPLQPIVRQGEGDDQIFHDLRLDLVRLSAASAEGDGGGDPPTINNYTVGGAEESLSVRAGAEVVIAYSITGADSVSINQGIGAVDPEADTITGVYAPEGVTAYTITATNAYGTAEMTVTITGVADVILAQDWDILYDSKDANAGAHTWAATIHPGTAGDYELAHAGDSGNRPNYAFDTGALAEGLAGIGPERVDKAIRLDVSSNTTSGFTGAAATQDWSSFYDEAADNLRISALVYVGSVTNGRRMLAIEDTTTEFFRVASISSNRWAYSVRADTDGGTNSFNTPTNTYQTVGWYLWEWVFRGRYWDLFQNGVALLDNQDQVNNYRPTVDSIKLCLLGAVNGTVSDDSGILFMAARGLGPSGTYSLANHQAFAAAVGVYTPP